VNRSARRLICSIISVKLFNPEENGPFCRAVLSSSGVA
jgi:hypothetical protein